MTLGLTGCHKCPYLHLERLFLCQPTLIDTLQQDQMLRQLLNSLALSSASSKNRISGFSRRWKPPHEKALAADLVFSAAWLCRSRVL